MNSASRGLRPTVGLRRPGRYLLRRRRPTPGAQRPGRPISIGRSGFSRDHCGIEETGVADWKALPSETMAVALGHRRFGAKAPPTKSDHGGIEKTGVAVRKALPPEMIAVAIGTPSPERRRRAQEGAARGRKGSRPAAPSKPPMEPSRRVCPKIVGQLLAVVLQGGQARQNRDTPEPPHPRVRARSGDGMPLKGSPPGCSPPG
jgi:hypothetical protein